MAHKNTQISDFSEQSTNVEVWVEIVRETTSQLNLKEKHLILGDPNGCKIEVRILYNLMENHYFDYFDR
ncbi:LOW QUALITY PROTEIN: hypothetical protein HID58_011703 [Brassica napus]|uniref:Uncharacterized protein n=1 Tax=Brassica napus TaxID=3708 RepID=A0ABQ8DZ14_BRANA|nr:LOW QUALITY PROTEIN: hypothetical protein HID58_011703 [Brassica napus]